ncbi:probable O-methyltransferase 3 [Humulus lupulus]|uniref:probable O-methyltransferase 3 n=1 Tax=Humulus lupulus TaxID=3486 RepID=UPI002B40B418|nr:probable O-methyltransferase 3 [Humulus lupulus]
MEKLKSFRHLNNNIDLILNEENSTEILGAQAHIWNQIFNFINSMSLKCAIQLGIPDIINNHGKPMTISQLTLALPINRKKSPCVYRLMRILIHSGFFALQKAKVGEEGGGEEEGYVITDASKLLLKDNPMSVTPFLLAMLDPVMTKPWDFLSNWFQNGDPTPFDTANGMAFWDYGSHEPKLARFFNDAMASDARLVTSVVIEKCKGVFEGVESLVDVGGGTGTVASSIAAAFPHIQCTVFDLPHVVADLQGGNNLNFVGGDMFVDVPATEVVLLKWILHDWNDEESVKILKKCKEAISKSNKKGGKVIIIDMKVENEKDEDDESYETQLFFDMLMMALVTGRERNEKEWAKLFKDAGFSNYKITPILGLRSLIEVYP